MITANNDQLVNNDQQQQQQHLNDPAINNQLLQHQRQQQEFLLHYRQALARLQKEDPVAAAAMPGINATEIEEREKDIVEDMGRIIYSKRYQDLTHEYRHVILPKTIAKYVPSGRLLKESEWRALGVIQSPGWIHYMIHEPEPHILLFKRPIVNE